MDFQQCSPTCSASLQQTVTLNQQTKTTDIKKKILATLRCDILKNITLLRH